MLTKIKFALNLKKKTQVYFYTRRKKLVRGSIQTKTKQQANIFTLDSTTQKQIKLTLE